MTETPDPVNRENPERKRRSRWLTYVIEFPVAILCGLGLLGLLLLLLDVSFPGSTGLGELVHPQVVLAGKER